MSIDRFSALNAEPSGSLAFWHNKQPKCPHCGKDIDVGENDIWRIYEEGEHDIDCPYCDLEFSVSTHVAYSFSTDSQEN